MMSERVRIRDYAVGMTYDLSSRTLGQLPIVANLLGTIDSVTKQPTHWHKTTQRPADEHLSMWATNAATKPGFGKQPKEYPKVAIMSFDKQVTDELHAHHPQARHAGLYVLGTSVCMAGMSDYTEIFRSDPINEERYVLGMRVGKTLFQAQPGLLDHDGIFYGLSGADMTYRIVPLPDVDSHIVII